MPIFSYRDLIVWQKAIDLCVFAYRLADALPDSERFGLASQLRRAATSVPANLAEGHSRGSRGDYRRHVSVARGSLAEFETHLELLARLSLCSGEALRPATLLAGEVGRMLTVLLSKLKRPPP